MSLATLIDFVNTLDLESGEDVFTEPSVLGRWLNRRGLIESHERITARGDLERAIGVREGLRALLTGKQEGEEPFEELVQPLAEAGRRARYQLVFDGSGPRLISTASGIDGALGRILATMQAARLGGDWERLKACANDACQWAFYDESRNQSRRWCRMDICGNRAKVRAHRARESA